MTALETAQRSSSLSWRLRLVAWCLGLLAIAFIQTPARIATDTKLDLSVDPIGFIDRSLRLWDPAGSFGQVQNQAYGYLFPMGPFFALGHVAQFEPWVVQRLWWGLILVVAFLGVVKLTGVLGIGVGWTRVAAGLMFALSPRILSVLGPSSIEVWPTAVAPWVLVPLVIGMQRGSPRRAAALSAVAVACVGGVNAAATFAVIPVAALWLLVSPKGPRRRAMMGWWPLFVLMGTAWWLGPLLLLGRYSPPFLDYIESASSTTFTANALDALRGTSDWVPYIDGNSVAGNNLITQPLLLANLTVLLCLGVLGLARPDLPHRRFLLTGLLGGMVLVTLGHTGSVQGLGSDSLQAALDGVLAPLRNTHKFDLIVRLPLVLGACHAITVLTRGLSTDTPGRRSLDVTEWGVTVLAVAAIAGATVPAWTASVANRGTFIEVPGYWDRTATWLERHAEGRTILTPATGFGDYVWGKTADEPLQPLVSTPWAVRSLIPLTPGGTIGMLDAVSARLATGRGSEGLAAYFRRAGIGTFVVRHDLDRNQDIVPPELARATLSSTPGIHRVAAFGPLVGGGPTLQRDDGQDVFVDQGWQTSRPAVEVFELDQVDPADLATRQAADDTPVLVGDSDSLLTLDDTRAIDGSVVMAKDADRSRSYSSTILTDGNRRQEASFGTVNHQRSASLTPGEPYQANRPVHRYDQSALKDWITTPQLRGARSISSSSSQAEVGAVPFIQQSAQTWAAFDGDPLTGWQPSNGQLDPRAWVRVDLDGKVDAGTATIRLRLAEGESRSITVTTEQGPTTVRVQGSAPTTVDVGRVSSFTLSGRSSFSSPLVVDDVTFSGLRLSRPLVLPSTPAAWGTPQTILLQAGPGYDDGCARFGSDLRCSGAYYSQGDSGRTLDRELTLRDASAYTGSLRAAAIGGPALTSLLQEGRLSSIAASSQSTRAAAAGPLAAADGDAGTGWVADKDDLVPTLSLSWVGERTIRRVDLRTSALLASSTPTRVTLRFSDGQTVTAPVEDGVVRFDPVRSASVRIQVVGFDPRYSVDFSGAVSKLPVGVSEASVPGIGGLPILPDDRVRRWPCGTGPTVAVDGTEHHSRLLASPRQLAAGETVPTQLCSGTTVPLDRGTHRITVTSTEAVRPVDLSLEAAQAPSDAVSMSARAADTQKGSYAVTTHNTNPGWTARAGETKLDPVVFNGWQQGWRDTSSTGAGVLHETFQPGPTYRHVLVIGGLLALSLLLVTLAPSSAASPPSLPGRGRRGAAGALALAGLATALLVAGPLGLLAAVVGAAVPLAVSAMRVRTLGVRAGQLAATAWVATSAIALAGMISVLRPWAGASGWAGDMTVPQLLVVLALGCLAAGGLRLKPSLRRRKGISTNR